MKLSRKLISLFLSTMVVCGCVFVIGIPVNAAGETYQETLEIYEYTIGGAITWTHSYDGSAFPVESAELTIVADDVDGPGGMGNLVDGEQDAVYFNGNLLGYLNQMAGYSNWSYLAGPGGLYTYEITTTTFEIDIAWIDELMLVTVGAEEACGVEIETATLAIVSTGAELVPVSIDIKPWSEPNSINSEVKENAKNGVIPVAILGSADLDVESIDWSDIELHFGPVLGIGGASPDHVIRDSAVFTAHIVYPWVQSDPDGIPDSGDEVIVTANNDQIPDLVVHFPIKDAGFSKEDKTGYLWGEINGSYFQGEDTVRIVK